MTLPYISLGLYIITSIFYIFPSGQPQPADLLIMLTMAFAAVLWWYVPRLPNLYMILAMFCTWIIVVNTFWFGIYGGNEFLLKSAYYLFNAFIFIFVIAAGWRDRNMLYTIIRWACIIALFAQLAHILIVGATTSSGVRTIGTFNNPNQLGYWALLALAILAVAKDSKPLNVIDLAAIAAGGYAVIVSLSKGATIAGALLIIMILVFRRTGRVAGVALAFAIVGGIAASQFGTVSILERIEGLGVISALEHRMETVSRDDDLMVRGYQVIVDNPQHWAFGAGEGAYPRRFANEIVKLEIHSTIGNLFFSYGIIGLTLFGLLLWMVFRNAPWSSCAYFIPIMLYGITHMGLRFSEFWIFLAVVYLQGRVQAVLRQLQSRGGPAPELAQSRISTVADAAAMRNLRLELG